MLLAPDRSQDGCGQGGPLVCSDIEIPQEIIQTVTIYLGVWVSVCACVCVCFQEFLSQLANKE